MQSEQTTVEKPSVNGVSLKWIIDKAASEEEMKVFWKKLRHFYRTGEKPKESGENHLTSIFKSVLNENEGAYPFTVGEQSIEFGPNVPFGLLNQLFSKFQEENRRRFKGQLQELISGLNKLLAVEANDTKDEETFDFASAIIAFDKLSGLVPKSQGEALPESRSKRLQSVLVNLKRGLDYFGEESAILVITEGKVSYEYKNAEVLSVKSKELFSKGEKRLKQEMETFTELIRSFRIAKLEVEAEYREEVHDEYFTHFSWYRLSEDEKTLFHPFFIVLNNATLMQHLDAFSNLISFNWPMKVLVINDQQSSVPNEHISWEDASHRFRQEIATLAISHRNVFTFQATLEDPNRLINGLNGCLKATSPAIVHLMIPQGNSEGDFRISKSAGLSRYFPALTYDPLKGKSWQTRFDISGNNEAEKVWMHHAFNVSDSEGKESVIDIAFTYADYKAQFSDKVKELMVIPSTYYSDYLVSMEDYLQLEENELYGKIPYIWVTDENHEIYRAAVPNVWVVSTQERLDFWNFIQELGNTVKKQSTISEEEIITIEQLKAEHEIELAKIREEALGQAASHLITALLDEE